MISFYFAILHQCREENERKTREQEQQREIMMILYYTTRQNSCLRAATSNISFIAMIGCFLFLLIFDGMLWTCLERIASAWFLKNLPATQVLGVWLHVHNWWAVFFLKICH